MKLHACALLFATISVAVGAQPCHPPRDKHHRIARSHTSIRDFKRTHPCPANGRTSGRCPGYVIDHVQPLCACGPDTPANMQWQTRKASKVKDRQEWRLCRKLRH